MARLHRGDIVSPEVSARVLRWVAANADLSMVAAAFGLDPLAHAEPDRGITLINKTGTISTVRADVGIVAASRRGGVRRAGELARRRGQGPPRPGPRRDGSDRHRDPPPHRCLTAGLGRIRPAPGLPVTSSAVACPSGRRCITRNDVWAQTHRGFKSHRHRTMKTPDFHWNPSDIGGFHFLTMSVLGTFWAHFSHDADDFGGRNVFERFGEGRLSRLLCLHGLPSGRQPSARPQIFSRVCMGRRP